MTSLGHHKLKTRVTARQTSSSRKGFTLIELLIVMLILTILAGLVIISVGGVIGRGQQTAYEGDDESIRTAVAAYYVAHLEWPTFDREPGILDMVLLTTPGGDELPYLDSLPNSASALNCAACTGHYTWSVDANARVTSKCLTCEDPDADGYQGVYP